MAPLHPYMLSLLHRIRWRLNLLWFATTAKPIAGGSPEGEGGKGEGAGGEGGEGGSGAGGEGEGGEGEGEGAGGDGGGEPDWKSQARKHERRAKAERKAREEAEVKLKEREEADKSEQDKALEKAREEARAEALSESQKERRQDRLEVATTRLAAKGVKVGTGDGAETRKFADPEDALIFIERDLANGDLDTDDIFDSEGKVQTDALETALSDLLKRKPRLAAGADDGDGGPSGDGDGGRGSAGGGDLDDKSVEEHLKDIQKTGR